MIQVTGMGAQKEALRQRSIADLVTAHKMMHPEVEHGLRMSLERFKKSKTPGEIAYMKALTKQALSIDKLSEQKSTRIERLLDEEEEALRTGNELKAKEVEEFLDIEISGEVGAARARDVFGLLGKTPSSTLPEEKFDYAQEKDLARMEASIAKDTSGHEAIGFYQLFNQKSGKNYVYIRVTEPRIWPRSDIDEVRKVQLGEKADGTRIRAKDVYYSAKEDGLTVEEYLDAHPEVLADAD